MPSTTHTKFDPMKGLYYGALALALTSTVGTLLFWFLGECLYKDAIASNNGIPWTLFNCFYHMVITVTTIGYGDLLETNRYPIAALFTYIIAFIGMGVPVFMISMVSMLIIDGVFLDRRRTRRMRQKIDQLSDHYILCGLGDTGVHILQELEATGKRYVIIDTDITRLQSFTNGLFSDLLYLTGDATREDMLIAAGLDRAKGIFACMGDDKENLFLTFLARRLEKNRPPNQSASRLPLRIVTKAMVTDAVDRLHYAGADTTICPYQRGGIRMVSEMKSPAMTSFMDGMLSHPDKYRFDELTLGPDAPTDQTLAQWARELTELQVIAHLPSTNRATDFNFNPSDTTPINPGDTIVVIGPQKQIAQARNRQWN